MANGKELKTEVKKSKVLIAKPEKGPIEWNRVIFLVLGIVVFLFVYYSPMWPDAIDPDGKHFVLTKEAKGAIALFLMAGIWWVFEVLPIGVTAIAIGVIQALFMIRKPDIAFKDFMDPSVWFIFASLAIGVAFTRTGLTKRMAYTMLKYVGEKTSMIYLGCFVMIAFLTLIMAHTAVAAAMFPLLVTINSLYEEDNKPTRFGKGLFIGMAFVAGAGSIVTLLGAARGIVALGLFKDNTGVDVGFFELTYYMLPLGWIMVGIIWIYIVLVFKPERKSIEGLSERVKILSSKLGPLTKPELLTIIIVGIAIVVLGLQSFVPEMKVLNKSAILLLTTLSFFIFKILTVKELEEIPWNIILLFGGAMCIGFCLWQTGAASWIAVNWLVMFQSAPWLVFVLGIAFFVLIMTNFIMNVAAIAISLPVAFAIAPYLGVAGQVVLFASLATAGMPFLLLIGAAPNAIAYESKQFSSGEFFRAGIPMSIILMLVLTLFISVIWPLMGMPVLTK